MNTNSRTPLHRLARLVLIVPLALLTAVGTVAPVQADPPKDPFENEIKRIRKRMESEDWVLKSIALMDGGEVDHPDIVGICTPLLEEKQVYLRAFALHALRDQKEDVLWAGLTEDAFDGLVENLGVRSRTHREWAHKVLVTLAGEDHGPPSKWKRWWRDVEDDLEARKAAARDRWQARMDDLPEKEGKETFTDDLYKRIRELKSAGMDLVLVFDQTGSMGGVIQEVKDRLDSLIETLGLLVDRLRIGVVTYTDSVSKKLRLTADMGEVKDTIEKVNAGGGADFPEGVDKGLIWAIDENKWRGKGTAKAVVIVGDAPPHEEDVEEALQKARIASDPHYQNITVHTVSTAGKVKHFPEIAEAGRGQHMSLGDKAGLERMLLTLAFGPEWKDALEPFLEILYEVREGLGQ